MNNPDPIRLALRAFGESLAVGLAIYFGLILLMGCADREPLRPERGKAAAVAAAAHVVAAKNPAPTPDDTPEGPCTACGGSGWPFLDGSVKQPCPLCNADGKKPRPRGRSGDAPPPAKQAIEEDKPTPAEPVPVETKIAWRTDYAAAEQESRETGKPLWVHATMQFGCPYCVAFDRGTASDEGFIAYANQHLVPFKVTREFHANAAWCRAQGIRTYPTDIVTVAEPTPEGPDLLRRHTLQLSRDAIEAQEQLRLLIERSVLRPVRPGGLQRAPRPKNPKHLAV